MTVALHSLERILNKQFHFYLGEMLQPLISKENLIVSRYIFSTNSNMSTSVRMDKLGVNQVLVPPGCKEGECQPRYYFLYMNRCEGIYVWRKIYKHAEESTERWFRIP